MQTSNCKWDIWSNRQELQRCCQTVLERQFGCSPRRLAWCEKWWSYLAFYKYTHLRWRLQEGPQQSSHWVQNQLWKPVCNWMTCFQETSLQFEKSSCWNGYVCIVGAMDNYVVGMWRSCRHFVSAPSCKTGTEKCKKSIRRSQWASRSIESYQNLNRRSGRLAGWGRNTWYKWDNQLAIVCSRWPAILTTNKKCANRFSFFNWIILFY